MCLFQRRRLFPITCRGPATDRFSLKPMQHWLVDASQKKMQSRSRDPRNNLDVTSLLKLKTKTPTMEKNGYKRRKVNFGGYKSQKLPTLHLISISIPFNSLSCGVPVSQPRPRLWEHVKAHLQVQWFQSRPQDVQKMGTAQLGVTCAIYSETTVGRCVYLYRTCRLIHKLLKFTVEQCILTCVTAQWCVSQRGSIAWASALSERERDRELRSTVYNVITSHVRRGQLLVFSVGLGGETQRWVESHVRPSKSQARPVWDWKTYLHWPLKQPQCM